MTDSSILELITQLKSGVMVGEQWQETEVGSPQGGVISPLIANIYLGAFDQEMRQQGQRIVVVQFCERDEVETPHPT